MLFDGAVGPADPVVSAVGTVCGFCISSVRGVLRVLYVLVVCCVANPGRGRGCVLWLRQLYVGVCSPVGVCDWVPLCY